MQILESLRFFSLLDRSPQASRVYNKRGGYFFYNFCLLRIKPTVILIQVSFKNWKFCQECIGACARFTALVF